MKKNFLVILLILFLISAFFAYNKHFKYILPKEYKKEVEILLKQEIPKATKEIDELCEKIENEKDSFDKTGLIEMGVDGVFFSFYWKLVDITEKFIGENKIINSLPHNDNVWEIHEALIPYLKNNRINTSKIFTLIDYGIKKQKTIEKKYNK